MTNFRFASGDPLTLGEIQYPCVVKASLGEDTKAVRLVKNQETLHAAIEHALSYSDHVIIERYKSAFVNRLVCLFKYRICKALLVNLPADTFAWNLLSHCFTECWLILQVHRRKRNPLRCFRISENWDVTSFAVH